MITPSRVVRQENRFKMIYKQTLTKKSGLIYVFINNAYIIDAILKWR